MAIEDFFARYDAVTVLDTETSGLHFIRDEVIEFACIRLCVRGGRLTPVEEYDQLVRLSPGKRLSQFITRLTGISQSDLQTRGADKATVCAQIARLLDGNTLIAAYNAHFDLSFLFYMLQRQHLEACLRGKDKLDLLTVYKDRRDYPHKLKDAIAAYQLQDQVVNSHCALDDVRATVEVMKQMALECDDLQNYINLFGYHPSYGVQGAKIASVRYLPQSFDRQKKLYEKIPQTI